MSHAKFEPDNNLPTHITNNVLFINNKLANLVSNENLQLALSNEEWFTVLIGKYLGKYCLDDKGQILQISLANLEEQIQLLKNDRKIKYQDNYLYKGKKLYKLVQKENPEGLLSDEEWFENLRQYLDQSCVLALHSSSKTITEAELKNYMQRIRYDSSQRLIKKYEQDLAALEIPTENNPSFINERLYNLVYNEALDPALSTQQLFKNLITKYLGKHCLDDEGKAITVSITQIERQLQFIKNDLKLTCPGRFINNQLRNLIYNESLNNQTVSNADFLKALIGKYEGLYCFDDANQITCISSQQLLQQVKTVKNDQALTYAGPNIPARNAPLKAFFINEKLNKLVTDARPNGTYTTDAWIDVLLAKYPEGFCLDEHNKVIRISLSQLEAELSRIEQQAIQYTGKSKPNAYIQSLQTKNLFIDNQLHNLVYNENIEGLLSNEDWLKAVVEKYLDKCCFDSQGRVICISKALLEKEIQFIKNDPHIRSDFVKNEFLEAIQSNPAYINPTLIALEDPYGKLSNEELLKTLILKYLGKFSLDNNGKVVRISLAMLEKMVQVLRNDTNIKWVNNLYFYDRALYLDPNRNHDYKSLYDFVKTENSDSSLNDEQWFDKLKGTQATLAKDTRRSPQPFTVDNSLLKTLIRIIKSDSSNNCFPAVKSTGNTAVVQDCLYNLVYHETLDSPVSTKQLFRNLIGKYIGKNCLDNNGKTVLITLTEIERCVRLIKNDKTISCTPEFLNTQLPNLVYNEAIGHQGTTFELLNSLIDKYSGKYCLDLHNLDQTVYITVEELIEQVKIAKNEPDFVYPEQDNINNPYKAAFINKKLSELLETGKPEGEPTTDEWLDALLVKYHGRYCLDEKNRIIHISLPKLEKQLKANYTGTHRPIYHLPEYLQNDPDLLMENQLHYLVRNANPDGQLSSQQWLQTLIDQYYGKFQLDATGQITRISLAQLENQVQYFKNDSTIRYQGKSKPDSFLPENLKKQNNSLLVNNRLINLVHNEDPERSLQNDVLFERLISKYLGKYCLDDQDKIIRISLADLEKQVGVHQGNNAVNCPVDVADILSRKVDDLILNERGYTKAFNGSQHDLNFFLSQMKDPENDRKKHGASGQFKYYYQTSLVKQKTASQNRAGKIRPNALHTTKTAGSLMPGKPQYMKFFTDGVGLIFDLEECLDVEKYSFLQNANTNSNPQYGYKKNHKPSNLNLYASIDKIRENNRNIVSNQQLAAWNELKVGLPKCGVRGIMAHDDRQSYRLTALEAMYRTKEVFELDYDLPVKIYQQYNSYYPTHNYDLKDYDHELRIQDAISDGWHHHKPELFKALMKSSWHKIQTQSLKDEVASASQWAKFGRSVPQRLLSTFGIFTAVPMLPYGTYKMFQDAFKDPNPTYWHAIGKVLGIILATVTVLPAVLFGMWNAVGNIFEPISDFAMADLGL